MLLLHFTVLVHLIHSSASSQNHSYLEALRSDPDIILGGRSYDPAPFAAFTIYKGADPSTGWHMGKILECGAICALPKGRSIIATVRGTSFDLTPLAPAERCTPQSVAAHTLYEKTRPDRLAGPGGVLHLDGARYEQITPKTIRVSGARFEAGSPYQIKLEGVMQLGYRTIFIGGIRDPILIGQIDEFLERVRKYTQNLFPELDKSDQCRLIYHVYGKNGVMGPLEPTQYQDDKPQPHEVAVLGEVVAPTSDLSYTIANNARASILHFAYPGQVATTGNFASPLSPHEQDAGPVFKFSLYHLVDLDQGEEKTLFPVTMHTIGSGTTTPNPKQETITPENYLAIETGTLAPLVTKSVPKETAPLSQIARIVRSKNSGPFEMTFDVMFDDIETFNRVKQADVLTNETIRKLYNVVDADILTNMYFEPALAWKCTIKRPWAQGSVGERDTLGTQQHAPLFDVVIPAAKAVNGVKTNGAAHTNGVSNGVSTGFTLKSYPEHVDRTSFLSTDVVTEIWNGLDLPQKALTSLQIQGHANPTLPSSYKVGILAQSTIALAALAAAQIHALRNDLPAPPNVDVPLLHATAEYKSERLYVLDGKPAPSPWGPIGGLHKTSDGYVRVHDSFPNHAKGTLALVGLPEGATREQLGAKMDEWTAVDVETASVLEGKMANYALRSYRQWDALPQSKAISNFPIDVNQLRVGEVKGLPQWMPRDSRQALKGLRVVEMSRVIAAPLAGKTLAAHGADVIWVTSPNLPDLPTMDRDFGRGKRTVQLDVKTPEDKEKLIELLRTADVFIQGFRPGSLAAYGLSPEDLLKINPSLIFANMSAFGPRGPWSGRRGFDSLVQTCSGMNVSEAEHASQGEAARPTPCQALDHAGGFLLATGVIVAVYKRAMEGGSWRVDVSLAGAMKYLRSLGQYPGSSGFDCKNLEKMADVPVDFLETKGTGFGDMTAIRHSAAVEGCEVGWDVMPKPLGSDKPEWL